MVWREGMRFPDVIIELLSDSTRAIDRGEKKHLYEQAFRTEEYYLYDPFSYQLTGYHLHGARYEEQVPDEQGCIFSPVTGLSLGVRGEWLRWLTEAGELVPTPQELADQERQRANQEQHRADQEQHRADQAEQRANQAEQLLQAYRQRFGELK